MSAINGIFERNKGNIDLDSFNASLNSLDKYGVESKKLVLDSVAFGFQRTNLFFADKTAEFPFYDEFLQIAVLLDGRIDNRIELAEKLEIPFELCKGTPLHQILLKAWQKWGEDCPLHIFGDYAFAIWDAGQQMLFAARDHVGARAFFYSLNSEKFVFASDLSGVLADRSVSDKFDEEYVLAALADKRFCHINRTFLADAKKLPGGYCLTVTPNRENLRQYWHPENSPKIRFAKEEDYYEQCREILFRAVRDRLQTSEKVGTHLSGGLDSGTVTVLTAQERREQGFAPPDVFSWQPTPNQEEIDSVREYKQIYSVCRQENLTPQFCLLNSADVMTVWKKDPTNEPIHITLPIEYTIQKRAAECDVKLLLSGWGGDEGISYNAAAYFPELFLTGQWIKFLKEVRKARSPFKTLTQEIFLVFFQDRATMSKKLKARSLRANAFSKSFLREDLKKKVVLRNITNSRNRVHSTLHWLWTRGFLADRMESWAASAANFGIQYAYPLSDRRLLEFLAGIPSDKFLHQKWSRNMLRQTMKGILPNEVCFQPDKREPMRIGKGLPVIYETLAMVREELLAKPELPSRAKYFEMVKFMDYLKPESLSKQPKQADATKTVQFLDF